MTVIAVTTAAALMLPAAQASLLSLSVTILLYLIAMSLFSRRPRESPVPSAPVGQPEDRGLIAVDHLPDPTLVIDADWRVAAANAAARDLFGPRVADSDLRLTLRHPQVLDAARLALAGQGPVVREVAGLGSQDGAFRVRAVGIGAARVMASFVDITQTRLTERMRVDFVANASHELRTPLATISGFIETLQGPASDDPPARARFLEIMGREAGRMSRLIDDLLSLSRIELDKYVRPQGAIDLNPLLSDVGRTLAMRLEADDRVLRVLAEPLPPVIADRDQILQVLHNLVSNALKYGRHGSPITLSAAATPDGGRGDAIVRVAVRDEGEGIAPEHLPRLTERFYRVDTSRSRSMGGTGLGLAIVKHIVERHRGRLDIVSRQGEGTEVSFTLPVAAHPAPPGEVDAAAVIKAQ